MMAVENKIAHLRSHCVQVVAGWWRRVVVLWIKPKPCRVSHERNVVTSLLSGAPPCGFANLKIHPPSLAVRLVWIHSPTVASVTTGPYLRVSTCGVNVEFPCVERSPTALDNPPIGVIRPYR